MFASPQETPSPPEPHFVGAVQERAAGLIFLRVHPRLDAVRKDPRYKELVRRVGPDAV